LVAFFYIVPTMKVIQPLIYVLFVMFLVGCVSDNSTKASKAVEQEKIIEPDKKIDTNKKPPPTTTKDSTKQNAITKASNQKNKNSNKAKGKKAILNNSQLSVKEREVALAKFNKNIIKPDEYQLLKKIAQNPKEHLRLREDALKKIYKKSGEDAEMLQYLFSVIRGKDDRFKPAVLYALKTMSYSSHLLQQKKSTYLQTMRDGLLTTQSTEAYRQLIRDLAAAKDPEAAKTLINNLKTNDFSKFALKDVFPILNRNKKPAFYPSLHSILKSTKKVEIKIGILPLISDYPPGRTTLLQLLDNKNEDIKVRLTAAEVISDTAKPQFYKYTRSIIFDENDNIKLRRYCLQQLEKFDFKIIAKYNRLQKDMESFASTDVKLAKSANSILKKF